MHLNIVFLVYIVCLDKFASFFPTQVCLVMEYAEGGSLYNGESICNTKIK